MIRAIMPARLAFVVYLLCVVGLTLVHEPPVFAGVLVLAVVLSGRRAGHIFLHVLRALLFFNITVSVGYGIMAWMRGEAFRDTLILINLRVFTLTWLTFLLMHRVHLPSALSFSRTLLFFLTLSWSQARLYSQIFEEFRLALESRSPDAPTVRSRLRMISAAGRSLVDRALHDAEERALSMKARMFFEVEGQP